MTENAIAAGDVTDRLIAERVMGMRQHGTTWLMPDGRVHAGAFRPSTDIAHAWMVVERLVGRGFAPRVGAHGSESWWATFQLGEFHVTQTAQTTPLAISRAAVLAAAHG